MHASIRTCLPLALFMLAACSPKQEVHDAVAAANAEFARLQAQDPDATAREVTKTEYPLTRDLMKAGGLDAALGGEAKADAALQTLYASYEHKGHALQVELQHAASAGGGGGSGNGGAAGWGGMATSLVVAGLQNDMAEQAWERAQENGQSSGSHKVLDTPNGSSIVDWTQDGYTSTTTYEGDLPEGLKGKVTTKVKAAACPDAQGKVEVEFESTSYLSAGSGSAQTKVTSKLARYLDDGANLIDISIDSDVHVEQTTGTGSQVNVSDVLSTVRGEMGATVNAQNRSASNDDVALAQGLAKTGRIAALLALESAKKAWESGKCVDLQVRSDPAKRQEAKPNTAYTLFANPRSKRDGAPTYGTVTATLNGSNQLNPTGKVKADAKFDYANPEKKDQSATIDFEARSKRGVGRATLEFDTKAKKCGYRIGVGGGSFTADDITKPFSGSVGGITLTFTPAADGRSGRMGWHYAGGGDTAYTYTLSGPEESMTATYRNSGLICAPGVCAGVKQQVASSNWTRIEGCGG